MAWRERLWCIEEERGDRSDLCSFEEARRLAVGTLQLEVLADASAGVLVEEEAASRARIISFSPLGNVEERRKEAVKVLQRLCLAIGARNAVWRRIAAELEEGLDLPEDEVLLSNPVRMVEEEEEGSAMVIQRATRGMLARRAVWKLRLQRERAIKHEIAQEARREEEERVSDPAQPEVQLNVESGTQGADVLLTGPLLDRTDTAPATAP
eukprot:Hpha_TRINITY_DN1201_c0_g1::TRINITY_DN1201_c0_g1_i1::g.44731::m.44731